MRLLAYFRSLAAKFLHGSQTEADLEEELRFHIQGRADDLERSGLNRAEAERRARIEFGGQERYKEETREALGGNFIETLILDVRFSLRVLRKSPGFTIVAVLTLALAIGANAVVFGILNGLILRPLNVPRAESLYGIEHGGERSMFESYPDYLDLRDRNRVFDGLAGVTVDQAWCDAGEDQSRAWIHLVTGNYFDVLDIHPYLGRFFHVPDERGPNSAPYIVLSHGYWRIHFQDDRGVVGRVIRLNQHPFTIIGVAPPEFYGTFLISIPDFYVPMVNAEQIDGKKILDARATRYVFMALGHLKAGVAPEQAAADLNSIGAYLERTYPNDHGATTFRLARPGLYGDIFGGPIKAFVTGLMLLAGLILLAACANLGSLFAARAADRAREIALRLALGAQRSRILRTLFTEALLISIGGGALGLWGSVALLRGLAVWRPLPRLPINVPVNPDASVYVTALVLALASGILFALTPARQALKVDSYQIVKAGSAAMLARRITARDLLLAAQIAICAVLVTSSMVALRGLVRSLDSDFGFDPRNAMVVEADLAMAGYRGEDATAMQRRMIDAAAAIPGVESVGLVGRLPLNGHSGYGAFIFSDRTTDFRPSNAVTDALRYNIAPAYFHAARTALLAGRDFSWHDDGNAPRVAVVNRTLAASAFGSPTHAVGASFKLRDGARIQVVGVVEDGKYMSLTEDQRSALFLPILQAPMSETWLVARSNRDAGQLAAALRIALRDLDSELPANIQSWNQQLDFVLFPSRVATVALGILGAMGAVLSITGIFGLATYSVSRRMKELGIRMALGARRKAVLQAALGRALKLLAFGSMAGLALGLLAAKILASIVYQATPRDPVVLSGVVLAMALFGLLATWIPAQRALSADPLTLLREE